MDQDVESTPIRLLRVALMILVTDFVLKLPHQIPKPRSRSHFPKRFMVFKSGCFLVQCGLDGNRQDRTAPQLDDETINVRIPAGAKPGSRIRIKGKGRPSPFSQQRGDLYLTIEVLPHPYMATEIAQLRAQLKVYQSHPS